MVEGLDKYTHETELAFRIQWLLHLIFGIQYGYFKKLKEIGLVSHTDLGGGVG